jgi:formate hydrogenlyase subunit 3/multisubunit Na+/H+ antiporter MnhD subunit
MSTIGWGLLASTGMAGLGVLAAVATPARGRPAVVGGCTAAVGASGIVVGLAALDGEGFAATLPWLLPLVGVRLAVDQLAGIFLVVAGAVVAAAAVYGVGYAGRGHGPNGRAALAVQPLFGWTLLLVPCAGSVSTFLAVWELMAATSLVLVVAEHRHRAAVAEAGVWYVAMTQAGFVTILLGLVTFAAAAGGDSFDALRAAHASPALGGLVFVLILAGFGAKAGLVPLHVWLPRAHVEAPSHASAMLSAAMVNLGVYGVVRVGFDLLGVGPRWWWVLVLTAGAASAGYGILHAAMTSDLKRLLAYSTVENMGLVFIGVGAAGIFSASGSPALAALALAAALLHVANHAAFKTLLFFAAGAVVRSTGTRDLDALGGLRSRLPATTALFAFGALCACALPPGNGFVSEWLLLQSLVHAIPAGGVVTAVAMPIAVAMVALTAGLAVATFVKALGVGFFARPRTEAAAGAREAPPSMVAAMGLAAIACAALAVAPASLGPALSSGVGAVTPAPANLVSGGGVTLRLAGIGSTLAPLIVLAAIIAGVIVTVAGVGLVGVRVRRRRSAALWACGGGAPTPRMQYTATSFAEPMQRVFDDVLAPETDVDVTAHEESRYLLSRVAYRRRVPDRIEHRLYSPLVAAGRRLGRLGAVLANGSVHRYLAYGFVGVLGLLVALAVME